MTGEYLTVKYAFETEYVIEKSRFIGKIEHVESEEQARELIAAVKKKHAFATHVVTRLLRIKTDCCAVIRMMESRKARRGFRF